MTFNTDGQAYGPILFSMGIRLYFVFLSPTQTTNGITLLAGGSKNATLSYSSTTHKFTITENVGEQMMVICGGGAASGTVSFE